MPHQRFQAESHRVGAAHTPDAPGSRQPLGDTDTRPSLESLLLGLHFRNWLTESDQRFLTHLAPEAGRILLKSGDRWLHPANAEELGVGDFVPPAMHPPDAVFTQRCRMGDQEASLCEIHSARIGNVGEHEVILGVAGPDHQWDRSGRVTGFEPLIAEWRDALKSAAETFARLTLRLSPNDPYLVVNRASGRVVVAKDQLCHLLGTAADTVVDAEYSTVAARLRNLMNSRGLNLENVTIGETHLAVVTLLPERRRKTRGGEDSFFSEFFVHAMRNKVAVIATASSQLEGFSGEEGTSDGHKLASIIVSEAAELERLIDGLDLLAGAQQRPDRDVSILDEIDGAVRLARPRLNRPITVASGELSESATVAAPRSILATLAEAVLRSHSVHGSGASSRIRIHDEEDTVVVDVATLLDGAQTAGFQPQWKTYASRLADKLGFTCSHQIHDNGNLSTTISIPVEGKLTHV